VLPHSGRCHWFSRFEHLRPHTVPDSSITRCRTLAFTPPPCLYYPFAHLPLPPFPFPFPTHAHLPQDLTDNTHTNVDVTLHTHTFTHLPTRTRTVHGLPHLCLRHIPLPPPVAPPYPHCLVEAGRTNLCSCSSERCKVPRNGLVQLNSSRLQYIRSSLVHVRQTFPHLFLLPTFAAIAHPLPPWDWHSVLGLPLPLHGFPLFPVYITPYPLGIFCSGCSPWDWDQFTPPHPHRTYTVYLHTHLHTYTQVQVLVGWMVGLPHMLG